MKQKLLRVLWLVVLASPLLMTQGCSEDDRETAWWLASPWEPLTWVWAPAGMVSDTSGGAGGDTSGGAGGGTGGGTVF